MDNGDLSRRLQEVQDTARQAAIEREHKTEEDKPKAEAVRDMYRREWAAFEHTDEIIQKVGTKEEITYDNDIDSSTVQTMSNLIPLGPLELDGIAGQYNGFGQVHILRDGKYERAGHKLLKRVVDLVPTDSVRSFGITLLAAKVDGSETITLESMTCDAVTYHHDTTLLASDDYLAQHTPEEWGLPKIERIEDALAMIDEATQKWFPSHSGQSKV